MTIEDTIDYHFQNPEILQTALTHRSSLNEKGITESYERLEFLGDAVLEMHISDYLFKQLPDKKEGYLTSARSAIVRTESLAELAKELNLGEHLIMSKGEASTGGRTNPSILEDSVESLIGALFLDGGVTASKSFFDKFIVPHAANILSDNPLKDPKSQLQETSQAKGLGSPIYRTIGEAGPDHQKTFTIEVSVGQNTSTTGTGKSKQEAEQDAAQKALKLL